MVLLQLFGVHKHGGSNRWSIVIEHIGHVLLPLAGATMVLPKRSGFASQLDHDHCCRTPFSIVRLSLCNDLRCWPLPIDAIEQPHLELLEQGSTLHGLVCHLRSWNALPERMARRVTTCLRDLDAIGKYNFISYMFLYFYYLILRLHLCAYNLLNLLLIYYFHNLFRDDLFHDISFF